MNSNNGASLFAAIRNPFVLVLVGAVLLAVYSYNHNLDNSKTFSIAYKIFIELLRDLGIAMIVGAIVFWLIESDSENHRRKKIDEIVSNATDKLEQFSEVALDQVNFAAKKPLEALIQSTLPEDWFSYISREIQSSNYLRRDFRISMLVRPLDAKDKEHVIIEQDLEYTVKNLTDQSGNFFIDTFVEQPYKDNLRKYSKVKEILINSIPISKKELEEGIDNVPDTFNYHTFRMARKLEVGEEIDVLVRLETVRKIEDRFSWVSVHPSYGATVEARTEANSGLACFLAFMHSECEDDWSRAGMPGCTIRSSTKKPVMKYTALELSWVPVKDIGGVFKKGMLEEMQK